MKDVLTKLRAWMYTQLAKDYRFEGCDAVDKAHMIDEFINNMTIVELLEAIENAKEYARATK